MSKILKGVNMICMHLKTIHPLFICFRQKHMDSQSSKEVLCEFIPLRNVAIKAIE